MYFNQYGFGRRLKECRELIDMTQEELAQMVGVEKQHISRIERGARACSIDLLVILASTLHVSTDYLLMGECADKDKEFIRKQMAEMAYLLSMMSHCM
jgi:transcriptional regulator with XRE-family HTH domain